MQKPWQNCRPFVWAKFGPSSLYQLLHHGVASTGQLISKFLENGSLSLFRLANNNSTECSAIMQKKVGSSFGSVHQKDLVEICQVRSAGNVPSKRQTTFNCHMFKVFNHESLNPLLLPINGPLPNVLLIDLRFWPK